MKIQLLVLSILTFSFFSCNQEKKIEGFDDKAWRDDHNACSNNRRNLVKILLSKKEVLKEFDDDAVSALLGLQKETVNLLEGKRIISILCILAVNAQETHQMLKGKNL